MGLAYCKAFFLKNEKNSAREINELNKAEDNYNGEITEVVTQSNLLMSAFAATSRVSLASVDSGKYFELIIQLFV